MRKQLKFMALTGMASILTLTVACASVTAQEPLEDIFAVPAINLPIPVEEEIMVELADWPEFAGVSGTVIEVFPAYDFVIRDEFIVDGEMPFAVSPDMGDSIPAEGRFSVKIETVSGGHAYISVNPDTYIMLDAEELEEGMAITGFFDSTLPMPAIYPPTYQAIILKSDSFGGVFIGRLDEVTDSGLIIGNRHVNISDDPNEAPQIIFQHGYPLEDELSTQINRAMAVFYGMEPLPTPEFDEEGYITELIPVNPEKIVILFERAVHPIHFLTEEELAMIEGGMDLMRPIGEIIQTDNWHGGLQLSPEDLEMFWSSMFDPDTVQILVNGEAINAPVPFINRESGMVMVPVAPIAEALGYNVVGEGADVVIGAGITFIVGVDSYFIGRMAPTQLFAAPELHEDMLFVPLSFFHDILPYAAYLMDGNIVIRTADEEHEDFLTIIEFID